MPKRNLLYLYSNTADKHIVCHGVDFKSFLSCLENPRRIFFTLKPSTPGKASIPSGFGYAGGDLGKLGIAKYGISAGSILRANTRWIS